MFWVLKRAVSLRQFWLRNMKNKFSLHDLNVSPVTTDLDFLNNHQILRMFTVVSWLPVPLV